MPVISACAFIKLQSSNLGFKFAMSGACKKASLFRGLKDQMFLNFFLQQLKFQILYSFFKTFSKFFLDCSSIDNGDTAIGRGFRFPLVISTSINAKALR